MTTKRYSPQYKVEDDPVFKRNAYLSKPLMDYFTVETNKSADVPFLINSVYEAEEFVGDCRKYVLYLIGIIPDGRQTCLAIRDAPVFTDVKVPARQKDDPGLFDRMLRSQLLENNIHVVRTETISGYPYEKFSRFPDKYIRVYVRTRGDRRKVIEHARLRMKYDTAVDDVSGACHYYFNILARTNRKLRSAGWNIIRNYTSARTKSSLCDLEFNLSFEDINGIPDEEIMDRNNAYNKMPELVEKDILLKPRTIALSWDIETFTFGPPTGEAPTESDNNFRIFNICMTFAHEFSGEPLLKVAFIDLPAKCPQNTDYTIICRNESDVLNAWMECLGGMRPDFMSAFNGGNFDTPLVRKQVSELRDENGTPYGLLKLKKALSSHLSWGEKKYLGGDHSSLKKVNDGILQYNFGTEKIKIDASEQKEIVVFKFPGVIDVDIMVIFKRLYPKDDVGKKYNLNLYLTLNKLAGKEDLPYKTMHKNYKMALEQLGRDITQTKSSVNDEFYLPYDAVLDVTSEENATIITSYCTTDTVQPHRLMVKRTVYDDHRELAMMSFTSLADAFYRANGMKIRNLIAAACSTPEFNLMFSNYKADNEKVSYPGGYVFEPNKGLHRKKPCAGLDFSSLYPSIMRAQNYSKDKVVKSQEEHDELVRAGYVLNRIEVELSDEVNGVKPKVCGWTVHHCNLFGGNTKPITGYQRTPEGPKPIYADREPLERESMGVIPSLLDWLFAYRSKILKPNFLAYKVLLEKIDSIKTNTEKGLEAAVMCEKDLVRTIYEGMDLAEFNEIFTNVEKYNAVVNDCTFWKNKWDSKQKAVKVYMNTFYGECGNYLSTIYELLVSGGTTVYGQFLIKSMEEFVRKFFFDVDYGDTDSIYVLPPDNCFYDCWAEYEKTEKTEKDLVQMWTKMVRITQDELSKLKKEVNNELMCITGTKFLSMAYEEVLFPYMLLGKKKYAGVQHEKEINFYPAQEDLFIRGLEFIKQGKAGLAKEIGYKVLQTAFMPSCTKSLDEIVLDINLHCFDNEYPLDYFKITRKYKLPAPGKPGNVSVLRFVALMEDRRMFYEKTGDPQFELYPNLEPGDRFDTVVVERDNEYDYKGRIKKGGIADQTEYLNVYLHSQSGMQKMQLDKKYYYESNVNSILARFLCYRDDFAVATSDTVDYKTADKEAVGAASKYLADLWKQHWIKPRNGDVAREYKKFGSDIQKKMSERVANVIGASSTKIFDGIKVEDTKTHELMDAYDIANDVLNNIRENILAGISPDVKEDGDELIHRFTLMGMRRVYRNAITVKKAGFATMVEKRLDQKYGAISTRLLTRLATIAGAKVRNTKILSAYAMGVREENLDWDAIGSKLDALIDLTDEEKRAFEEVKHLHEELYHCMLARERIRQQRKYFQETTELLSNDHVDISMWDKRSPREIASGVKFSTLPDYKLA